MDRARLVSETEPCVGYVSPVSPAALGQWPDAIVIGSATFLRDKGDLSGFGRDYRLVLPTTPDGPWQYHIANAWILPAGLPCIEWTVGSHLAQELRAGAGPQLLGRRELAMLLGLLAEQVNQDCRDGFSGTHERSIFVDRLITKLASAMRRAERESVSA